MLDVNQALTSAYRKPPRAVAVPRRALVIGAAGALGAAVLEQLLATRRFDRVGALVGQAIQPAVHGFAPVHDDEIVIFAADTVLVVFDRLRSANFHARGANRACGRGARCAVVASGATAARRERAGGAMVADVMQRWVYSTLLWAVTITAQAQNPFFEAARDNAPVVPGASRAVSLTSSCRPWPGPRLRGAH